MALGFGHPPGWRLHDLVHGSVQPLIRDWLVEQQGWSHLTHPGERLRVGGARNIDDREIEVGPEERGSLQSIERSG